eukprot:7005221-Alexandrium_andersonii.AAC.1
MAQTKSASLGPTSPTLSTKSLCPRTSRSLPWLCARASSTTSGSWCSAPRPRPRRGAGSRPGWAGPQRC